jgi:hypothetical protein
MEAYEATIKAIYRITILSPSLSFCTGFIWVIYRVVGGRARAQRPLIKMPLGRGNVLVRNGPVTCVSGPPINPPYQICMCWDCEALRDAISATPPENDEQLRSLVKGVQEKVATYRTTEMVRRKEVQQQAQGNHGRSC